MLREIIYLVQPEVGRGGKEPPCSGIKSTEIFQNPLLVLYPAALSKIPGGLRWLLPGTSHRGI